MSLTDILVAIAVSGGAVAAAWGLAYWAHRALHDRSAIVGLYLLFGFPGALLVVAGIAYGVVGKNWGWLLLGIGLGFALPLVKPFRVQLARIMPIDVDSPIHMTGLTIILAVLGFLAASFFMSSGPDAANVESVDYVSLAIQVAAFVGFAYVAVGLNLWRRFGEATERLGLRWPTPKEIAASVGFVFLALILSGVAGLITTALQPGYAEELERVTKDMTANVQSLPGAIALGVSAGVGEELLFRGALQPRIGIGLTSLLFALMHVQYGPSFVIVGLFAIGILLGIERKKFGTTACILTHAMFNIIVVLAQR